jgi:hypothetical protein
MSHGIEIGWCLCRSAGYGELEGRDTRPVTDQSVATSAFAWLDSSNIARSVHPNMMFVVFSAQSAWLWQIPFWVKCTLLPILHI